jgi:Sec-independent protein translocase protein TatA
VIALLGNLSFSEVLVILVIALLVFGKRLPEVAVRASSQFVKAKRTLNEMWRQTGLEEELRRVRRDIESEQRRIEASLPEWRKELPDWKKLEGEVRKLDAEVGGDESAKASTGPPPAEGAARAEEGSLTISPRRDMPAPKTAAGAPPAAPAKVLEAGGEGARADEDAPAPPPEAPPASEESA